MVRRFDMHQGLEEILRERSSLLGIPCSTAFGIAEAEAVSATDVGEASNRIGVRIIHCQLGLFGYHAFGEKRVSIPLGNLPAEVTTTVREATDRGKLTCSDAWALAKRLGLPRPVVGQLAEDLEIRIVRCPLGCF